MIGLVYYKPKDTLLRPSPITKNNAKSTKNIWLSMFSDWRVNGKQMEKKVNLDGVCSRTEAHIKLLVFMDSIEDNFDSALNLEETHFKQGYSEGYKHGLTTGKEEARQVGLKTGFEVGEELGFYRGCVDVWNAAIRVDPSRFSTRIQKSVKQMEELIGKYPIMDPENESVQEIMDSLRLKFRVVRAGMGVKLEYDGYPKPKETEF
ncbi:hypothetical protein K2173_013460 [Erythroxylum novogranatense]|uniref:Essential protein Yae1 N-terminal domain-containing protein n=1 Tax=Erythroxylum novogranatense TaxID=1862640 RepID=A0AAV8S9X8_9ROSI|nr:hypothetical protein K2173_013460 [Erythroxylum novogranatense]